MKSFSLKYSLALAGFALLAANVCRAQTEWPKSVVADNNVILFYEPQILSYSGDSIRSRYVISVTGKGYDEDIFGVAWTTTVVAADTVKRERTVKRVRVDRLQMPGTTDAAFDASVSQ